MAVPPHTVAVTPRQRVLHSFSSVVITTFLFKSFSMYALICVALRCDYPLALEDESSAPPQPPPFSSDTYSKLHRASFHTCASHVTRVSSPFLFFFSTLFLISLTADLNLQCFSWRAEYGIIPIPGAVGVYNINK